MINNLDVDSEESKWVLKAQIFHKAMKLKFPRVCGQFW